MMKYNKYISEKSPASWAFVVALQDIIYDDVDMMHFLFGVGQ